MSSIKQVVRRLSFQQTVRPFIILQGLFGLAPFSYPSNDFQPFKKKFLAFILNVSFLILFFVLVLNVDFKGKETKMLVIGLQISLKTAALYCTSIIMGNFVTRKSFFNLLKLFESFDRNFERLTNDRNSVAEVNRKIVQTLTFSWVFKVLYRVVLPILVYGRNTVFMFYQTMFIRIAEEQFILFCFHLFERVKLLKKVSSNLR